MSWTDWYLMAAMAYFSIEASLRYDTFWTWAPIFVCALVIAVAAKNYQIMHEDERR